VAIAGGHANIFAGVIEVLNSSERILRLAIGMLVHVPNLFVLGGVRERGRDQNQREEERLRCIQLIDHRLNLGNPAIHSKNIILHNSVFCSRYVVLHFSDCS
jgi:hypothetical protein